MRQSSDVHGRILPFNGTLPVNRNNAKQVEIAQVSVMETMNHDYEKKLLASVVIPTYNEEKCIIRALISLEHQTIPREVYEIVIVDGRSSDRTVELAKKYANKIIQQKNKGVAGARNDGVAIAEAEIIATTDADCVVPRDWLERILKDFESRDFVCLYGPVKPLEKSFKNTMFIGLNNFFVHLLSRLRILNMAVGSNTAFRRREFIKVGGYPVVSAGDDYGLPIRFKRRKFKVRFDKDLFVYFSMRRYEKYGFLRSYYRWLANVVNEMNKKKVLPVKTYQRQIY